MLILLMLWDFLEDGNHDCDTFDYTLFRLDYVLNMLMRYLDTETTRADARIAKILVTSPIVINIPTRELLVGETKGSFV